MYTKQVNTIVHKIFITYYIIIVNYSMLLPFPRRIEVRTFIILKARIDLRHLRVPMTVVIEVVWETFFFFFKENTDMNMLNIRNRKGEKVEANDAISLHYLGLIDLFKLQFRHTRRMKLLEMIASNVITIVAC